MEYGEPLKINNDPLSVEEIVCWYVAKGNLERIIHNTPSYERMAEYALDKIIKETED